MIHFVLNFDGSCGPKNPGGTAAYGFALSHGGEVVRKGHGIVGSGEGMTNNLAEFHALYRGLLEFKVNYTTPGHKMTTTFLQVLGDSNLAVQIMNRRWKPNREKPYYPAFALAAAELKALRSLGITVSFDWIPRAQNTLCDDLSKAYQK